MTTIRFFESTEAFRAWLEANAESEFELLVGFRKVATGRTSMTWSESVDEALCFGWIDGVRRRIDDQSYSIRFTPRKPSSQVTHFFIHWAWPMGNGALTEADAPHDTPLTPSEVTLR